MGSSPIPGTIKNSDHIVAVFCCLFPSLLFVDTTEDVINVLAVPLTSVEMEFNVGDTFHRRFTFEKLSEVTCAALQEDKGILFLTLWDGSKKYKGPFEVWRYVSSSNSNHRVGIRFTRYKLRCDFANHPLYFGGAFTHTILGDDDVVRFEVVTSGYFSFGIKLHTKFTFSHLLNV